MDLSNVQLITTKELADNLRVSPMTIYRLVKSGEIPYIKVGKNFRFVWADVATALEETTVVPDGEEPIHAKELVDKENISLGNATEPID